MYTGRPQIAISRVFDAPRSLVYRAFTDPDHFVSWWGPTDNVLPRSEIEFDIRSGGYQRWTEFSSADPDVRVQVRVDLTDVTDGELLDGLMAVSGRLPDGCAPFETRLRVEFSDETDGRTRLSISQWLPRQVTGGAEQGWREALTKLAAALSATPSSSQSNGAQ